MSVASDTAIPRVVGRLAVEIRGHTQPESVGTAAAVLRASVDRVDTNEAKQSLRGHLTEYTQWKLGISPELRVEAERGESGNPDVDVGEIVEKLRYRADVTGGLLLASTSDQDWWVEQGQKFLNVGGWSDDRGGELVERLRIEHEECLAVAEALDRTAGERLGARGTGRGRVTALKPLAVKTRSGEVSNPEFEKKHKRKVKGRTGGGQFDTKSEGEKVAPGKKSSGGSPRGRNGGAPGDKKKITENDPEWNWRTMGNKKRGVILKNGQKKVVGPEEYDRLKAAGQLSDRTPKLRGDDPKDKSGGGKSRRSRSRAGNPGLKQISELLQDLGYDLGDAGVTDKMTPALRKAIRRAQAQLGLHVTGEISTALRSMLNRERSRKKAKSRKTEMSLSADEQRVKEASVVGNPPVANSPSSQTGGDGSQTPHGGAVPPVLALDMIEVEPEQYPVYPQTVYVLARLTEELEEAVGARKEASASGDSEAFTLAWSHERAVRARIEEAGYAEHLHPRDRRGRFAIKQLLSSEKPSNFHTLASAWAVIDRDTGKRVGDVHPNKKAALSAFKKAQKSGDYPKQEDEGGRPGLEGPFRYRSGWEGFYDPKAGRYLGRDDVYMPRDFDPDTGARAGRTTASDYLADEIDFGGEMLPRGEVIKRLKAEGASQAMIDRYLQGAAARKARKPGSKMSRRSGHDLLTEADVNTQLEEVKSSALPDLPNKPGKTNWVEKAGGLPKYIERIAKHLHSEKGMTVGHAIATAVNVVKKMCASGDTNFPGKQNVNVGSKAEACAAVASWERKKGSAKVKEAELADSRGTRAGRAAVLPVVLRGVRDRGVGA